MWFAGNGMGLESCICISGPLGAGKSELCRAIIRARIRNRHLEVPSPSYTLVNVYDHAAGEIWHADLYRIGDVSEIQEIGLEDAIEDAIVLVEWPERWLDAPQRRLDMSLHPIGDETREISVTELTGVKKIADKAR